MCIVFKMSEDIKRENAIYSEQMRRLAMYFSSIDEVEIRENLINFFEKIATSKKNVQLEVDDHLLKILTNSNPLNKNRQ